ncbi:MAG: alpha/beta hydrolase [Chloroflexota bacterium]
MKNVRKNNLTLSYERRGTGKPLLLIHGFPLDHGVWEAVAGCLETDFDLIMPDLPGFGLSDVPAGGCTIDQMAYMMGSLLDDLGINKIFIVGHSMGGYVAFAFAHIFPSRVLGLGLLASQAAPDTDERKVARAVTAGQVSENGVSAVAGMSRQLTSDSKFIPFFEKMILSQRPEGVIGALEAMAQRPDALKFISEFIFPVILVHGLADILIPLERASEIQKLLPTAKLIKLPGIGHSPMLEAPAETALALKMFLQPKKW